MSVGSGGEEKRENSYVLEGTECKKTESQDSQ